MSFDPREWFRLAWEDIPVYVRPDPPCWFVPNEAGDHLLQEAQKNPSLLDDPKAARFFQRLPSAWASQYTGRGNVLRLQGLKEFWIHLTDRCNLSCTYCLFAASPSQVRELSAALVLKGPAKPMNWAVASSPSLEASPLFTAKSVQSCRKFFAYPTPMWRCSPTGWPPAPFWKNTDGVPNGCTFK